MKITNEIEDFRVGQRINNRRPSKITIPERAHPWARLLFAEMKRQNVSYQELQDRSGILISTTKAFRGDNVPGTVTIEACLGALGWTLVPVPRLEGLPDEVRNQLEDVGQHFRSDEETLGAVLLAIAEWPEYARKRLPQLLKLAPAKAAQAAAA